MILVPSWCWCAERDYVRAIFGGKLFVTIGVTQMEGRNPFRGWDSSGHHTQGSVALLRNLGLEGGIPLGFGEPTPVL
jgi:hypothetical protein